MNASMVVMVERTLQDAKELIKVAELKRRLPKRVMHQALIRILDYLQANGKILVTARGVVWTHTPPEAMEKMKKRGLEL